MFNVSRRSFLSVGAFGMLSMPQILQAQQENSTQHKAVINIFLAVWLVSYPPLNRLLLR